MGPNPISTFNVSRILISICAVAYGDRMEVIMAQILLSAFADEYSHDPRLQVEVLKKHGFGYLEPRFINGKNIADLTEDEAQQLRALLDEGGISVYSIGSPLGKISVDDDMSEHLERAERCFRNARILGATRVRMFSFYLSEGKSREECRDEVLRRVGALLDLADKYGLILCHENEAKIYGEDPKHCLDLLSHFGGRLRCVFDMGNFVLDGCEPYPYGYELLCDYIDYFHIKDSLAEGAIVPAGLGQAHIKEILAAHKALGKDFVITLEPHLETFAGLNSLTGSTFVNPYKFENERVAFDEAAARTLEIVASI